MTLIGIAAPPPPNASWERVTVTLTMIVLAVSSAEQTTAGSFVQMPRSSLIVAVTERLVFPAENLIDLQVFDILAVHVI